MSLDPQTFADNLRSLRERISAAAARSNRDPENIRLMVVTKTFPLEYIEVARKAGLTLFGENRIQEAQAKYQSLTDDPDLELHLIGHLQRNKAKIAASLFRCVQSIDKLQTAEALNRYCSEIGRTVDILLELNTSGEETKFGYIDAEQLWQGCGQIAGLSSLRIRGVMTVGPFTSDRDRMRRSFASLRECLEGLRSRYPELSLDTLSMGMSGDFEIAVEEGATMIRVGTVLFGLRGGADSWGSDG
jgi:pyridoxal phosphate enzyme (YggS family)